MTQSTQDIWLYCINCERAFRSSSKNSCNYSGCEGELGDVWEWEVIRKLNQGYPKMMRSPAAFPTTVSATTPGRFRWQ